MKIFLDTGEIAQIHTAARWGALDGALGGNVRTAERFRQWAASFFHPSWPLSSAAAEEFTVPAYPLLMDLMA